MYLRLLDVLEKNTCQFMALEKSRMKFRVMKNYLFMNVAYHQYETIYRDGNKNSIYSRKLLKLQKVLFQFPFLTNTNPLGQVQSLFFTNKFDKL